MEHLVAYGFLAPPTIFITLCLAGAVIALVRRRGGIVLVLLASLCLFAAATPALSSYLLHRLEAAVPGAPDLVQAQAIVVLSADIRVGNGRDIIDMLGPLSIERLAWAAAAYRRLRLPVLVSGGHVEHSRLAIGTLMKAVLEHAFYVPVAWDEDRSTTTRENAIETARLLLPQQITRVVLVTHAWHQPRAIAAFARAGLTALPWPAPRDAVHANRLEDFLPSAGALQNTFYALHEMLGLIYYRWRG